MTSKNLLESFMNKKYFFHEYIKNIKIKNKVDIYTVINPTLICNPYVSDFAKNYFMNINKKYNKVMLFLKHTFIFYFKMVVKIVNYFLLFLLFKTMYKKDKVIVTQDTVLLDIFFLTNNIINDNELKENYFFSLYDILDKKGIQYAFIPRLYGIAMNPFKFMTFINIINNDKRNFMFEYEYLSLKDFLVMFVQILTYPFTVFRFYQKKSDNINYIFNNELFKDISNVSFDSFSRFTFGKNIAKYFNNIKIFSWSEFQVIERSFNYAIRTNNKSIKLYGCQFFLNYETYFNTYIDDMDFAQKTSFHTVLVNGEYYILDRKKVTYKRGVSLRYQDVFFFNNSSNKGDNIILLGSYIEKDTKFMLDITSCFDKILFKNHPAVNVNNYGKLNDNVTVVNDNIYKLFKDASIVIGTASGSSIEAVASGISVIIIASNDNLTANPLVNYGKGKIWDIAFSKDDVKLLYNNLIKYRRNNISEIKEISSWYKDNFFIEPTEKNIIKAFELNKELT